MRNFFNSFIWIVAFCATSLISLAQGVTLPNSPSPKAKVSQTIGISTVTISYSRPSVKGREVWGKLVPYGYNVQGFGLNKRAPWRAGANLNTVVEFSHNASVEGKEVPAGSYGLFFVINQDNTGEVILSKDFRSWGSFWYDSTRDVLRAPIKIRDVAPTELLTYDFINLDKNSADLVLNWEKKQFPVSVKFAVEEIVIANAKEELKGPVGFTWKGYSTAANYALNNKVELETANAWIDQAIAAEKNFETLMIKSGILEQSGKSAEASKAKTEAISIGKENELNTYGYQLLGESKTEEAVAIFKLNTEKFPKSANAWDSLGEGYAIKGDSKNAIASFKKSLGMNPPVNVKANSEKYLRQLGAMK